ncbi:transposase [Methylobacterium oryzihabitans]|nr:transposase [Methylobacterium oryzihabitans]
MLTERQWTTLEPLLDLCRPRGKTPPHDLRGTVEAILWRHCHRENWRAVPPHYGPWWRAAQTFNRWSKHGVWQVVVDRLVARFEENGWPVPPTPEAGSGGAARQDELRSGEYQVHCLISILNALPAETAPAARSVPAPIAGDAPGAQPAGSGRETGEMTRSLLARTEFAIAQAASLRAGPASVARIRPSSRY